MSIGRSYWLLLTLLPLAIIQAQAQTPAEYVEGEVIVTFKASTTQRTADSSLKKRSLRFERRYERLSALRRKPMGLVRNGGRKTQDLIAELKNDPTVETVEPNYLRHISALPADSRFNEQWALQNTGQVVSGRAGTIGADISYVDAWAKSRTPDGEMVVAVVDTGVDVIHPEIAPRMWTNSLEIPGNNVDDDSNGYTDDYYGYNFSDGFSDPSDSGSHGTHVAGTIAAQGNNTGVIGVNDHVKIMALRVSSNGDTISTSAVIEAIEYAVAMKQRGINIVAINSSYGGGGFSSIERAAIISAGEQGIILCAAAGNNSRNNNTTNTYPASYGLTNMIVVASSDHQDALSSFSNYGSTSVDLAAPGSQILSTIPATYSVVAGSRTYAALRVDYAKTVTSLTGQIVDCGLGHPGDFPVGFSGKIALIQRGEMTFAEKVSNAQTAGAIGVVIYDNVSSQDIFEATLGVPSLWIPVLAVRQTHGQAIKSVLPTTLSFVASAAYQSMQGTSMATPHVSAAVAFAALNFPNETLTQRKQRILASVDVTAGLQGRVRTNGRLNLDRIVDADQNGMADWSLNIANVAALKGGILGLPYSENLTVDTGTPPYQFTLTSGSLPPGITLTAGGLLSGLPEQTGSFTFTIAVTNEVENSGSKTFTLFIAAQAQQIVTASLPDGYTGAPYSFSLTARGGTGPYLWSLTSGSLPDGFSLSPSGVISGLTDLAENRTFKVSFVDAHRLTAEADLSLAINPSPITITRQTALPYGVRSGSYSQSLTASGGTTPYTWSVLSGTLPRGLTLSSTGILSGKPALAGNYEFRLQVRDATQAITSKIFTVEIRAGYSRPVMNPLTLGSTFIGAAYTSTVSAENYPSSYKITGLPSGLTYSSKTGAISGRPKVHGDYTITVTATNTAGTSLAVSSVLSVRNLPPQWVGTFTGIITRNTASNKDLGSRFNLTTTSLGAYSLKVITGTTSKSATGYLVEGEYQVDVLIHGQQLRLALDPASQLISGFHGAAAEVRGWRNPWPENQVVAAQRIGYYSAALNPATSLEPPPLPIPLGSGYLTIRISSTGLASITGRTSTGDTVTSSSILGPSGETAVYQSLYSSTGSLTGSFNVQLGLGEKPAGNSLTGTLTWLKPVNKTRYYPGGFGSLSLDVSGGYLALTSSGSIVQGLPNPGVQSLIFSEGGLDLSDTVPNLPAFDFTSTYLVKTPLAGSSANLARTTLTINKATGAISGSFTLSENETTTKRKVSFLGMIIPHGTGGVKAQGYFLLPQIPLAGERSTTSPILSGRVQILQPSSSTE
ncbi:putative Ig domain-containing protein [Prosthecobacter fusiformis]|uniref:Putative Ig domain-containing protein n=1 Tax=Prosthecobacter fusiformis TaxID=48464 RepID=A0A4R7RTJ3_9BACT|nr:S8 family serine peptidase [Prosthecobacter fusiformis]TDU68105.1 putative Ig domain-containing protein [Prosthecobacter fusiformis]